MSIKKENKEARINLLLPTELRTNYKIHCAKQSIGMSERIRELIEKDLNFEIKESIYYAVLKKTFRIKQKGINLFSSDEIQKTLYKPIFPVTSEQVEEVLLELYNNSILERWEYENGEIKYEFVL